MIKRWKRRALLLGLLVLLSACSQGVEDKIDQIEDQVEDALEGQTEPGESQESKGVEGLLGEYMSQYSLDMREPTSNRESRFFAAEAGERMEIDLDPKQGQAQVRVLDQAGQVLLELEAAGAEVERVLDIPERGQYEVQVETQDFRGTIDIDLEEGRGGQALVLEEGVDRIKADLSEGLEDLNMTYRLPSEIDEERTFFIRAGEEFKFDLELVSGTLDFSLKDGSGVELLQGKTEGRLEDRVRIEETGLYTLEVKGQNFVGDLDLEIDD